MAVKPGRVKAQNGTEWEQVRGSAGVYKMTLCCFPTHMPLQTREYFKGLGTKQPKWKKYWQGTTGDGYEALVAEVYEVSRKPAQAQKSPVQYWPWHFRALEC